VAKGVQVTPVALEIAKVANKAVDEETAIEPVARRSSPAARPSSTDRSRRCRASSFERHHRRLQKLDSIENAKITKEQAVLVLWRKGDHLVGFLYRSKKTIDLELVIKETPRLYALTNAAIN
jgi:hypothetical protein